VCRLEHKKHVTSHTSHVTRHLQSQPSTSPSTYTRRRHLTFHTQHEQSRSSLKGRNAKRRERGTGDVYWGKGVGGLWVGDRECDRRKVTRHASHVTRHTSHVTRHTSHPSHVTRHTHHTSHVTRHTSHVTPITRHTSHVTRHTSHPSHHTARIAGAHQTRGGRETNQE